MSRLRLSSVGVACAVAAATVALLIFLSARTTLWDRDEARFAESAREMLVSGNLLTPTFDGSFRTHKPPFVTWLMALSMRFLGPTERAARLPSALALGAAVLLTFDAGRSLVSSRAGALAAAFLATAPLALLEGGAATADSVLLAALTGMLAIFARAVLYGPSARHVVGLTVASALAQLTKGPVALILPLLSFGGALLLFPNAFPHRRRLARLLIISSLGGLVGLLAWAIPANRATHGLLLTEGLGRQVLGRSLAPMEGHGGGWLVSLPFYVPVLLIGFSPWTLYLPGAIRKLRPGGVSAPARALLIGGVATPFAFFTLVATKLPHYVLPAWPLLAIAVAAAVESPADAVETRPRLRAGWMLLGPLVILELAALAYGVRAAPVPGLAIPVVFTAALLVAAVAGSALLQPRGATLRGALWLAGGVALTELVAFGFVLPRFEALKPVPSLARDIRRKTADDVPVATCDFAEPSLDFYLARPPIERLADAAALGAWAHRAGPGVLVTSRAALEQATRASGPLPLDELAAGEGVNVSKGRPLRLVALRRRP